MHGLRTQAAACLGCCSQSAQIQAPLQAARGILQLGSCMVALDATVQGFVFPRRQPMRLGLGALTEASWQLGAISAGYPARW